MLAKGLKTVDNRLTLSRIKAFNAVMESGSFSSAALSLNVSQSAINQQIREIERKFDVRLFEKLSNSLAPTPLAKKLYKHSLNLQRSEREMLVFLREQRELRDGLLRIGLGNSMPGLRLISHFQKSYPSIQIQVETGNWGTVSRAVLDRRVDIGLLPNMAGDERFRTQLCFHQRVVAIVHRDHVLANRSSVTCDELRQHELIFRTPQSSTQDAVNRAFARTGSVPRPRLLLENRDGVIEAVANQMGVGFIWEFASSRTDFIKRIPVEDIAASASEFLFCRTENTDRLVQLFFKSSPVPAK